MHGVCSSIKMQRTEHSPHEATHNSSDTTLLCLFTFINVLIGWPLWQCNLKPSWGMILFLLAAVTSQVNKHGGECFQWKQDLSKWWKTWCMWIDYYWTWVCVHTCTHTQTHTHTQTNPSWKTGLKWLHCPSQALSMLSSFFSIVHTHTRTHKLLKSGVCCGLNWAALLRKICRFCLSPFKCLCFSFFPTDVKLRQSHKDK